MRFRKRNEWHPIAYFALICLTLIATGCDNTHQPNTVAQFLSHADRQYETHVQQLEIERALRDMLEKNPDQLRAQRYADYEGHPGAWSITALLERYFVPVSPISLDPTRFYQDVPKPEAQKAIQAQLSALKESVPAH